MNKSIFNATPHNAVRMIELPHRDAIVFTYRTYGQYLGGLKTARKLQLTIEKIHDNEDYKNNSDAYPDLFVLYVSRIGVYTAKELNYIACPV